MPETCDETRSSALRAGVTVTFGAPLALPKSFCTQLEQLAQTVATPLEHVIRIGAITIETRSRTVSVDEQPIATTKQEYALLLMLAHVEGVALSHQRLGEVLGHRHGRNSVAVQAAVRRLRIKLRGAGAQLTTDYGVGFRLLAAPPAPKSGVRLAKTQPTHHARVAVVSVNR